MDFALVGYFMKRTTREKDWTLPANVLEICSVSDCMNPSPPEWMDRWVHNDLGFFNTIRDARSMIADDPAQATSPDGYQLFAFRLLPIRFEKEHRSLLTLPSLEIESLPTEFVSLGFDVVSKSVSAFFECSPLSCNALAEDIRVNEHCLVDTLAEAERLAVRCALEEPEPGPYYVMEVLRESR